MKAISNLFIDKKALRYPQSDRVRSALAGAREVVVDDSAAVYRAVAGAPDSVDMGKQILFLTLNRGP
ncbi:MAG: DNA photolyase, partial [Thermodesulfobacteriota bacterium]